ncbi:MAG: hypothetical protein ACI30K_00665 [Muribaculaceae bacterium]
MASLNTRFGKAVEQKVAAMLLEEGRDVYLPTVDDHGVDILVAPKNSTDAPKASEENELVELTTASGTQVAIYQELQVKAVSYGLVANIKCPDPRPNYWYVLYVKSVDTYWLINSMDFVKIASQNVKGKNVGKYSLDLATKKGTKKHTQYIITDFSRLP